MELDTETEMAGFIFTFSLYEGRSVRLSHIILDTFTIQDSAQWHARK